jgi:DNA polymerase-3 subunit epsilon
MQIPGRKNAAIQAAILEQNQCMLPCYVMLDLETTGTNAQHGHVTEIAAVRVEEGREVARWSSLVNPGVPIPAFIQQLTGISDAMVAQAPPFAELAPKLLALLDGAVLVAHNARFDHGFLKSEFARLEIDLHVKTLCSVRLSRKLYPQHRSHSLDAIIQRHGLHTSERHRAMGDVDMVLAWLDIAAMELGRPALARAAAELLQGPASMPSQLQTPIKDIPDAAGVYIFYGEGPLPLYIGKSVHLRSRVLAHFQADHSAAREMRITQEIRRVEWRQTAGELGALLLEARLIKQMQPLYNHHLRRARALQTWCLSESPQARPLLTLLQTDELEAQSLTRMFGIYRSRRLALEALRALADEHALCQQTLGLDPGWGRCFAHQLGRCKGVCCGQEKPELHYLRLQLALASQRRLAWPYAGRIGIREDDPDSGRCDIHVFAHWCHLATVHDESELHEVLQARQPLAFDMDNYQMLSRYLAGAAGRRNKLLKFGAGVGARPALSPAFADSV